MSYRTPGWRNWQTQRTQNPPVLSTLGVQLPLPAPDLKRSGIKRSCLLATSSFVVSNFSYARDHARSTIDLAFGWHRRYRLGHYRVSLKKRFLYAIRRFS